MARILVDAFSVLAVYSVAFCLYGLLARFLGVRPRGDD